MKKRVTLLPGLRKHRTYSGRWDEQSNTREGKVRDIEAILRDEDSTGVWGMGGESLGVHTKGWQGDVVKRRMEREVEREAGQDLQIGLDPGEGLESGAGRQSY